MLHLEDLIHRNPQNWLTELTETYKVMASFDSQDNPRLVSLKYNQIESPMHEPIVQECRGTVVDLKSNKIIALPYSKFWNIGDHLAAPIDWSTARVQEKLDGSLMLLYWHDDRWAVASSGHPTAGGSVGKVEMRFADLFWKTFDDLEMEYPSNEWKETTFMFELMTADNRIVVRHEKPRLVLHGSRALSGFEWSRERAKTFAQDYNWEIVKEYPISSADDALKAAEALDPLHTEGFVVVSDAVPGVYNRVKIKSPRYVALHHLKGEFSPRRAIELWQAGEVTELLGYFPEMAPDVQPICNKLNDTATLAYHTYLQYSGLPSRKDFALKVKQFPFSAICFRLLTEPEPTVETSKTILRNLSVSACERLIGL